MEILYPKDEFEIISEKVEKLGKALKEFKDSGINWRVFNRYLRGLSIPQSDIDSVMGGINKFFGDLGIDLEIPE